MSAPLPPFERPGEWRAKVTIYRDNVAIATADTYLTDPGQTFDLGYATHQIGNVIECEPTLTARGKREQAAFERGQG